MIEKMISFLNLSEIYNDVLIIGNQNYFINTNYDVEIISDTKIEANHYLSLDDFISRKKYPFNYKYKRIIVEEKYLEYLNFISHLLDDSFKLIFILDKDYLPEKNSELIDFIYQDKVEHKQMYQDNYLMLMCERNYE